MKKVIAGIAISAMALIGGTTSAVAAPAPSTLVLSGGSGVYQLDPIVINATASAAGVVAFKLSGKVITGCESVATTTVAPFVAKCSWVPAAAGAAALSGSLTPTDSANFVIPEVDLGIPLAWGGIPRLVREIGPAATKELVLTCRPFGSAEAKSLGFLNTIVSEAELDDHVQALAESLAAKPGYSLRTTKQQVNAVTEEMIGTARNANDADSLVIATYDAESRAASAAYLKSKKKG